MVDPAWVIQLEGGYKGPLYFLPELPQAAARGLLLNLLSEKENRFFLARGQHSPEALAEQQRFLDGELGGMTIPLSELPHSPEWHRQDLFRKKRLLLALRGPP